MHTSRTRCASKCNVAANILCWIRLYQLANSTRSYYFRVSLELEVYIIHTYISCPNGCGFLSYHICNVRLYIEATQLISLLACYERVTGLPD